MNLQSLTEWPEWETLSHLALVVLYIYVLYVMYNDPASRSMTNMLLLMVALAGSTLIHQNINDRNNVKPVYFL